MLACEGDRRPLIGHRRDDDASLGPFALPPLLEPLRDPRSAAARGSQEHPIWIQSNHRAVIENDPGLAQHDAVACAPRLERR